ncbi:MAG TPA: hypothetical protein PLI65_05055 [Bacteroidales bacterium]|nr:hypothetical protein [Bacteroidales bacterium]HRW96131.1 hypothetical protein [Bacteroidales bacterium]
MKNLFMKCLFLAVILTGSFQLLAQSDIDVVYLKTGERIECTIQKVGTDSLYISRFSGKNQVWDTFALDNVATYVVNNFYSTPAEDIIKATGHFFTGTMMIVSGGVIAAIAVNNDNKDVAVIGTAIGMFGSVFLFSGYSKMNHAGKKLNRFQLQNDRIIYKL